MFEPRLLTEEEGSAMACLLRLAHVEESALSQRCAIAKKSKPQLPDGFTPTGYVVHMRASLPA